MRDINIPVFLSQSGHQLFELFNSDSVLFLLVFVLLFLLVYGTISSILRNMRIFTSDENSFRRSGQVAAFALSLIAVVGMFAFSDSQGGMRELVEKYLTPFGYFGAMILCVVMFLITLVGLKDSLGGLNWKLSFLAAAMALMFFGMIMSAPVLVSMSITLFIIAFVVVLLKPREWEQPVIKKKDDSIVAIKFPKHGKYRFRNYRQQKK